MRYRHLHKLLILLTFIFFYSCSTAATLKLVEEGETSFRIVIPEDASPFEQKAASELQHYLLEISGAQLDIVSDNEPALPNEILIGNNTHLDRVKKKVKFDKLGKDGFYLYNDENYLLIAGGSEKGSLYGVYSLLESYMGCRFYTPAVQKIPKIKDLSLEDLDDLQVPVFDYREMYFPASQDSSYLLWHKLDRHQKGEWGMWVHTFDDLVPPGEYFDIHPEYFALVGDNRVNDGQLCLSNPEVLDLLIENLEKKMAKRPDALYWSVSQNDNFEACECEHCKALDEQYGGPSGTMLWFVNQVARQFPEKIISTLAYQYTRKPPKGIKPEKNVNIMLCTIEVNRSRPIDDDPSGELFVQDLKGWSKMTDNILLWDYVVQFRNYVSPFPNFHVLQPNMQLFEKYGCKMMFQQGSGNTWSDFSELKSYLIAKLLWDPGADPEKITNDFLYGYYGDAAPYIREYFDLLHEELKRSGNGLWIYGYPIDGVTSFLSPSLLKEYDQLFDKAEAAVKDNHEILQRVRKERLPLEFAELDISLFDFDEDLTYFYTQDGKLNIREDMGRKLDDFVDGCKAAGVAMINEQGVSPEDYRDQVAEFVQKTLEPSMAKGKPVTVQTTFSPKYNPRGEQSLTDGLKGVNDYHVNWLGFEGEDMVAVVDLEDTVLVSRLSTNFLQFNRAWIFLPVRVQYFGSLDGLEFSSLGTVNNIFPDTQPGSFIIPYSIIIDGRWARYIKVEATSLKTCPEWHIGAGEKSWIFCDEIIVQ